MLHPPAQQQAKRRSGAIPASALPHTNLLHSTTTSAANPRGLSAIALCPSPAPSGLRAVKPHILAFAPSARQQAYTLRPPPSSYATGRLTWSVWVMGRSL